MSVVVRGGKFQTIVFILIVGYVGYTLLTLDSFIHKMIGILFAFASGYSVLQLIETWKK